MSRKSRGSTAPARLPEPTFIIDNGGYNIKAGFAPQSEENDEATIARCRLVPNAIVRSRDRKTYIAAQADENITQWSEAIFRRPVENGHIVSWEAEKAVWEQSFFSSKAAPDLQIKDVEGTTLVLGECPNMLPALQKNTDEIIMEGFGFGGYTRMNSQSLNAFNDLHLLFEGAARTIPDSMSELPMECLLVIDSGYSHTHVNPVLNGRPVQRAIRRLDFGGKHLTNLMKEIISTRQFDLSQDTKIVNDIKEDICFVSSDINGDLEKTWKGNKHRPASGTDGSEDIRVDYVLPDGIRLLRGFHRPHDPSASAARKRKANSLAPDSEVAMTLGNERFTVPEVIFNPSDIGSGQPGVADVVMQSMATLPPLIQATMLSNILVVGGNANIPGFVERLQTDLRMRVTTEWEVRVRKMQNPIVSSWLGGARLASQQKEFLRNYAVTREEYLENGSGWTARRMLAGPT
jgi:actin-related protein 6